MTPTVPLDDKDEFVRVTVFSKPIWYCPYCATHFTEFTSCGGCPHCSNTHNLTRME